jgi:hypothetical protein
MIKELINYFKLKSRAKEIEDLRDTLSGIEKSVVTFSFKLPGSFYDVDFLRKEVSMCKSTICERVQYELDELKSEAIKKINKMIEELENTPL